ncbi:MAG: hypothetical protein VX638_11270 [Chloroflexota bacterium]|nr:hypothetical protein [Chloroflexota bacterium]
MAEGEAREGTVDFDGAGETRRHLSLEQAKILALETARNDPANYGRRFAALQMVFQVIKQEEEDDGYFVTLSFQPEGDFPGKPGLERFFIEKQGTVTGRGQIHFHWKPLTVLGAVVALAVAAVVGSFAAGIWGGAEVEPAQISIPDATSALGKITLFLVPSAGNPRSLSYSDAGLRKVSLAQVPLVFGVPRRDYKYLRKHLWTKSSLTFSGTGFSGAWIDEEARLVMQLNGPMKGSRYLRCVGLRINGEEETSSCGTSFSSAEFVTGGYTVEVNLSAPPRLETTDRLEVSIVLATPLQEGEKVVPILVYGGDIPLKTSFLEIGSD